MMEYEVDKKTPGGTWINVIGKNAKQETMIINIVHCHCENAAKDQNSLPYLWHKHGWTDKVMENYISCETYVRDSEGYCWGLYNPQTKRSEDGKRYVINFEWLLDDTEENERKIIEECIRLFESATGKSATEMKMEHIMDVAKERNMEVVYEMPEGYKEMKYCLTNPEGAITIVPDKEPHFIRENGNLRRNPKYKAKLLVI